jgi:MOSC domain-containing protein YiiM
MTVRALNVGLPREVEWHGQRVSTGIFKSPVDGRVSLRRLNFDGDRQADLTVHGGAAKAAYCYPFEHYDYWTGALGRDLPFGAFGENLTTTGLDEHGVHLGDEFVVGTARVVVTQPRLPCYKLGIRFGADDMVKRFQQSERSGFYVAVIEEGDVGAGDEMTPVSRHPAAVSVLAINRLYVTKRYRPEDVATARRALTVAALPESWKAYFRERLASVPDGTTNP